MSIQISGNEIVNIDFTQYLSHSNITLHGVIYQVSDPTRTYQISEFINLGDELIQFTTFYTFFSKLAMLTQDVYLDLLQLIIDDIVHYIHIYDAHSNGIELNKFSIQDYPITQLSAQLFNRFGPLPESICINYPVKAFPGYLGG